MGETYSPIPGQSVQASTLRLPRALSFLRAIEESPQDSVVECLVDRTDGDYSETIIVDLCVARPQKTVHEICLVERIAGRFTETDAAAPEALALRMTFPQVPHLNLRKDEYPKSLCLYAEEWSSQRLRWHGKGFLERIREWLRLTARGELHQRDQPLEPLMFGTGCRVILPHGWLNETDSKALPLNLAIYDSHLYERVLMASPPARDKDVRPEQQYLMLRVATPAVTHGVIRNSPCSLSELSGFTDRDGFSLISEIGEQLKAVPSGPVRDRRFVLLVDFPKKRSADRSIEHVERKAFLTVDPVATVGEKLGVWAKLDGATLPIIGETTLGDGGSVHIEAVLNVSETCTWDVLALLNGEAEQNKIKILSIGAGALGSQVACNLARAGFGQWTVVDVDTFLPHNAARHAMTAHVTGFGKASAVAYEMNGYAPGEPEIAHGLLADVLQSGSWDSDLDTVLKDAELVLDMSASVPVARHLSSRSSSARIISLFLNPSGSDLVVLAEDRMRTCPLNDLEMLYYWAAGSHDELVNHLDENRGPEGMIRPHMRYGASCRDISSLIPHDFVALHAANGARSIRRLAALPQASMAIYRYDQHVGGLCPVPLSVEPLHACRTKNWEVRIAPDVLRSVQQYRKNALPNETGGVLIGGVDFDRSVVYVIGVLAAPDDSVQFPNGFIRGSKKLAERLGEIERRTLGNLGYLGEWHSHPSGVGTTPSTTDSQLLGWIQEHTVLDGRPAVMMIAGQRRECRVVVGTVSNHKIIKGAGA